jgi:hypothetical protein
MNLDYIQPFTWIIGGVTIIFNIFVFRPSILTKFFPQLSEDSVHKLLYRIAKTIYFVAVFNLLINIFGLVIKYPEFNRSGFDPNNNFLFWFKILVFPLLVLFMGLATFVLTIRRVRTAALSTVPSKSPVKNYLSRSIFNSKTDLLNFTVKLLTILTFIVFVVFVYELIQFYSKIQNALSAAADPSKPGLSIGFADPVTISFISLIVLAGGTISTQVLSWIKEKREKTEAELRIEKLLLEKEKMAIELEELKSKQKALPKPSGAETEENPEKLLLKS